MEHVRRVDRDRRQRRVERLVLTQRHGIAGVAYATIIAQIAVIAFYAGVIATRMKVAYPWRSLFDASGQPIREVLRLGVPSAVQPVSAEAAMLVIASFAVTLGTESMAARVYVMNLATVAICWTAAMSIGNQVLVAILAGAGQHGAANSVLRSNLAIAVFGGLVIAAILRIAGAPLLGIFTSDPVIIAVGLTLLTIGIALEAARAFGTLTSFALKASGDANFPAIVSIVITWMIAIPLAAYLSKYAGLGMAGLWLGLVVDEALRGVVNYLRWNSGAWQTKGVTA